MVAVVSLTEHIGATVSMQCRVFLYSLILGACVGVVYDFFRVLRKLLKNSKVAVAIEDVIFFVIFTAMTFVFMLWQTGGQLRWYLLAGELLGWTLYYFTLGALVMKISDVVIAIFKAIFVFVFKTVVFLTAPLRKLGLLLTKWCKSAFLKLKNKCKRPKNTLLKQKKV